MSSNFSRAKQGAGLVKIIEQCHIDDTLKNAKSSDKLRLPILLNDSFSEAPQRFVNCLTAATYVRPHKHSVTRNWELMSWIDGIVDVILFDHAGKIIDKMTMSHNKVKVIEIPCDLYHTFITLNYGVYLEVRGCAYTPETDRVYAPWAPPEMTKEGQLYLKALAQAKQNDTVIIS